MIKRPTTKTGWLKYIGCQGWFNRKDGFLELNPKLRLSYFSQTAPRDEMSALVTVMGQKGRTLLVSQSHMTIVSEIAKKYVRIIGEEAA